MLKQRGLDRWHIACFVILLGGLSACGTTAKATGAGVKMAAMGIQEINGQLVERFDLTGDKKANIWKVYRVDKQDGKEERLLVRKDLDPNLDGKPDVSLYYNSVGRLERESMDLDFDGRIDAISYHKGGELVRRQMDLDFDGRMDVEKFYVKGKLVRKERDKDNNGRPDVWEYFQDGRLVRVGHDKDGDGKPETFEDAPAVEDDDEKKEAPPVKKDDKGKASA
jgi:hypothetical protein